MQYSLLTSPHNDFTLRDSHFIFGDACTSVLLEKDTGNPQSNAFEILGTKLKTKFSNNIRNNFGFLNKPEDSNSEAPDKLFIQNGRKGLGYA